MKVKRSLTYFKVPRACPWVSTEARGIRVYPQKIYLLVSEKESKFVSLPDAKNGYDIKPWSFLSKHDFDIKIEEGQLKELSSNQDTTAALTLVQKIVELAAKAAEPGIKAMPVIEFESSIGFKAGIYELSETGLFKKVSP